MGGTSDEEESESKIENFWEKNEDVFEVEVEDVVERFEGVRRGF